MLWPDNQSNWAGNENAHKTNLMPMAPSCPSQLKRWSDHGWTVPATMWMYMQQTQAILYSGKLLREKTFANFEVLSLFAKVSSVKFWGMASFGGIIGGTLVASASTPQKFSPQKPYFPPICKSFLPWKFPAIIMVVNKWVKMDTNVDLLSGDPCFSKPLQILQTHSCSMGLWSVWWYCVVIQ